MGNLPMVCVMVAASCIGTQPSWDDLTQNHTLDVPPFHPFSGVTCNVPLTVTWYDGKREVLTITLVAKDSEECMEMRKLYLDRFHAPGTSSGNITERR